MDTHNKERPYIFYGWIIVIVSLILLFGSFGSQLCFGVFLKPLSDEFGWTRAATSGAMSMVMGISGIFAIFIGRLTDRYKVRMIIAIGMVVGGLSYLLLSAMNSLWQLYACFGLGAGICVGCTYTPVNATISKWFQEKRALALGIALMGITIGQMALSPISAYIITVYTWRTAYVLVAILVFLTAVPAIIFLGKTPRPSESSQNAGTNLNVNIGYTTREAAGTAPFWMLMITGFVISAGSYFVAAHIVTYAIDAGIQPTMASLILTVSSVGGIGGTLLAWSITTRIGGKYTLLLLISGEALSMFLFIFTRSEWSFYLVAVIFGFSFGGAVPVRMSLVPPLFGLKAIGSILGFATFAWAIGGITGPVLAGFIFDITNSYNIAFVCSGILLILGALTVYFFGSHRDKS